MRNLRVNNIFILLGCLLFFSCEKLDLTNPEQKKQETENVQGDNKKDEDNPKKGSIYDVEANNADAPYRIEDILSGRFLDAFDNPDSIRNVLNAYVEGYIVGYVNGTRISQAKFDVGSVKTNIILADYKNENDWRCCIPVQLISGTSYQSILNLDDNPDVLGCKYLLRGTLTAYMSTIGLKNLSEKKNIYVFDDDYKDIDDPDDDDNEEDLYNIYSVGEIQRLEIGSQQWVEGYIVGYVPRGKSRITSMVFGVPNGTVDDINIVIADSINESDINKCAAVQLIKDTEARDSLNLYNHPENLHRKVQIHGSIEMYMGERGIKDVDTYVFP